jgi:arginyl-tRNA--protein-N-Asp/Glu arginylyltransferase
MQKYYPKAFQKFLNHKNDYLYNVIKENIIRGIKEELYRPEINVEILARYRVESILIPFNPEFHTKVRSNLLEIQHEVTLHFLYGLISQKGYKLTQKYQQERTKKLLADATK